MVNVSFDGAHEYTDHDHKGDAESSRKYGC